jgi:hypothetical protein
VIDTEDPKVLEVLDALGRQEMIAARVCDGIGESRGDWDNHHARVRTYGRLKKLEKLGFVTSRVDRTDGYHRLWKRADVEEPDPPEPPTCPHCGEVLP